MKDYMHGFASFDINVVGVDAYRIGTDRVITEMKELFEEMRSGSLNSEKSE
jgi:hypothetical protein